MTTEPCPYVSVVIPTFNAARWIEETLESVTSQSIGCNKLEVIVVDDGSSDETAVVSEAYLASSPLSWRVLRQANRGPGAARNVGWRAARANWIQFLDADDLLDPQKFEIQWWMTQHVDRDTAAIYSSWRKFGLLDARWEDDHVVTPKIGTDPVTELLYEKHGMATGSQIWRREWLHKVGGWDERYPNGEDHELIYRIAFAGGKYVYAAADRPLFFYRRHGPSLSSHSGRANAEVWLRIAQYVEDQSRQRNVLTERRLQCIKEMYAGSAIWLADYDWRSARVWIDHLLRLDPDFRLTERRKLRPLCGLFGFKRAVWIASRLRWLRRSSKPRIFVSEIFSISPSAPSRASTAGSSLQATLGR